MYLPLKYVLVSFVSMTGDIVKLLGKLLINVRLCNDVENKTV